MTLHIFDLDQTVINSDHRTLPAICPVTQNLDLAHYRKLATHDNIMLDKLLPLAEYMRELLDSGEKVAIVTARHLQKSDRVFLRKNGLRAATICSRDVCHIASEFTGLTPVQHSSLKDADYKKLWFKWLAAKRYTQAQTFVVYDDHKGVLEVARSLGFIAKDAIQLNKMFERGYRMASNALLLEVDRLNDDLDQDTIDAYEAGFSSGYQQAMLDVEKAEAETMQATFSALA